MAISKKLDPRGAFRLFDDLVRCETRLYNGLNDRLREQNGISTGQFEFLRYLRYQPNARVADLAGTFAIGIGATSKAIDRLEERKWIARLPNPDDRRSSLLALTPAGLKLVSAAESTFAEYTAQLVTSALAPAQVQALGDALALLRSSLERSEIGAPAG